MTRIWWLVVLLLLPAGAAEAAKRTAKKASRARPKIQHALTPPTPAPVVEATPPVQAPSSQLATTEPNPPATAVPMSGGTVVAAVASPPPPPPPAERLYPAVAITLAGSGFTRSLTIVNDLFGRFMRFDMLTPSMGLAIDWFPGAHGGQGVGARIGLHLAGSYAFVTGAVDEDGVTYSSTVFSALAAVKGRQRIGILELSLSLGAELQQAATGGGNAAAGAAIPLSMMTLGLRPEIAARADLHRHFALFASGAFIGVLWSDLDDRYFPRARGTGVDAHAGAIVPIGGGFELYARFDFRRVGFDLRSAPGDRYVAGGILDQAFGGTGGISWRR